MKRQRLQAATVGGTPDDLEQAFYDALNHADIAQLMACWAEEDEIVCVLPGGPRLIGPGSIRSAFQAQFARGNTQVRTEQIHKIEALASAVHHLLECQTTQTPQGGQHVWRTVTNVYHKTPQGWRMVAHHASPGAGQHSACDLSVRPAVLH